MRKNLRAVQLNQGAVQVVKKKRLELIDFLRGAALLAMAIYHFAWDLEFFGYSLAGTTAQGGWKLFARGIATSFLFLVGFSLYLAHEKKLQMQSFLKRFAMVVVAAAAISVATWFFVPDAFIFFGILHHIALASLLGLAFLRLPALPTAVFALLVIAGPYFLRSAVFNHPLLWWVGLSTQNPVSNDYVPIFPWFGAVLLGVAFAKWSNARGWLLSASNISLPRWTNPFQFAGQHSLAVYLIHQPVLIGCLWVFSQIIPASSQSPQTVFSQACIAQCEATNSSTFCQSYCSCVIAELNEEALFDNVYADKLSSTETIRLNEIVMQCSFDKSQEE